MFSEISWGSYLMTILTLTTIYYSFIGYMYYRKDIAKLLTRKVNFSTARLTNQNEIIQSFTSDLQSILEQDNGHEKKILMSSLDRLINKYPEIKETEMRHTVREHMIRECLASTHLISEHELRELWN